MSIISYTKQVPADGNAKYMVVSWEGLALGNIPAGQHKAIWLRRTISAAAPATANDTYTIAYSADYTA